MINAVTYTITTKLTVMMISVIIGSIVSLPTMHCSSSFYVATWIKAIIYNICMYMYMANR